MRRRRSRRKIQHNKSSVHQFICQQGSLSSSTLSKGQINLALDTITFRGFGLHLQSRTVSLVLESWSLSWTGDCLNRQCLILLLLLRQKPEVGEEVLAIIITDCCILPADGSTAAHQHSNADKDFQQQQQVHLRSSSFQAQIHSQV